MDTFFKWYFLTVGALFIISFFLKKLECTKEDVLVEELVDDVCSWFYIMGGPVSFFSSFWLDDNCTYLFKVAPIYLKFHISL